MKKRSYTTMTCHQVCLDADMGILASSTIDVPASTGNVDVVSFEEGGFESISFD